MLPVMLLMMIVATNLALVPVHLVGGLRRRLMMIVVRVRVGRCGRVGQGR